MSRKVHTHMNNQTYSVIPGLTTVTASRRTPLHKQQILSHGVAA